jgi:hypothetical protein
MGERWKTFFCKKYTYTPSLKPTSFQLIFKPKTAKSAIPTPVMVVAKESTETSSSSISRLLNLKELRLASEDLIKDVLPGIGGKDDGTFPCNETEHNRPVG